MMKIKQAGSALIVILVVVLLLTIIGVMAVRSGIFGLNVATSSQVSRILDQNNDAALFKIEDSTQFAEFLVGTGLFGYPKMDTNRDKELVICYRGKSAEFYQFYRASLAYIEKTDGVDEVKIENIGGDARPGFCQVSSDKADFVSGRAAAMTQIAVRVSGDTGADSDPFAFYQEGTDTETGKLDEAVRLIITATTVMPALSSETNATINACLRGMSYLDASVSAETVAECLSKHSVPFKTQVSEYSLGQFIKKVAA